MHQECNICMCEQHNQIMRVRNYMYSNVQKKIMNSHDSQIPRLDRLAGSKHVSYGLRLHVQTVQLGCKPVCMTPGPWVHSTVTHGSLTI